MTVCYLCKRDARMTREHIWSDALVALFDDAPLTLDERRGKVYRAAPAIKDVCDACNQALSSCDQYMVEFARKHLREQLSGKLIIVDIPNLARWILKTSANHSRAVGERNKWWNKYRNFIRFGDSVPEIDMFAASWYDPRPTDLQQLMPVPTLGAMSVNLHALTDPPWTEISTNYNAGWALKVGSAVFAFIDWIQKTPESIRYRTRDTMRGYGWSLIGADVFTSGFPFNEYTCVFYNIISDPTKPLILS